MTTLLLILSAVTLGELALAAVVGQFLRSADHRLKPVAI